MANRKNFERLTVQIRQREQIDNAICNGINNGCRMEKIYDRAVCIIVALEEAGFKIVRIPRKDGLVPGLKNPPPAPCLCGDYGPHTGCVDPGHWGMTVQEQAEEDAITATAEHLYGPVPNCKVCDHPLTNHNSDGCNAPAPQESREDLEMRILRLADRRTRVSAPSDILRALSERTDGMMRKWVVRALMLALWMLCVILILSQGR